MKGCLIVGPVHAMIYKEGYQLLRDKVLTVTERAIHFNPEVEDVRCNWFTTLSRSVDMKRRKLTKAYNDKEYPRYDNYDAVECKNKNDIPTDYMGKIGVPITFFYYYPELPYNVLDLRADLKLNNKQLFQRLIIQKRK